MWVTRHWYALIVRFKCPQNNKLRINYKVPYIFNYMKRQLSICILALIGLFSINAFAQTPTEIEMAKKLAVQQGYTESQVNAMITKAAQAQGTQVQQGVKAPDVKTGATRVNIVDQNNNVATIEADNITGTADVKQANVFGHSIFSTKNLNFVPSYNMPTPSNYKLAAGDEIIIDIWGAVVTNITAQLSPEGSVNIPDLGPVYISGQTIAQAERNIKEYLSKIYSGISDPTPNTFVKLALGKIRSFSINVLGEVNKPGTYTIPSLSTLASALYIAGGPNELGTIRKIKLIRNSKVISTFDVYEFITKGYFSSNLRLEDNDVIIVEPYKNIVNIAGAIKRPMRYELLDGETLETLIKYAGGFSDRAFIKSVRVDRIKDINQAQEGAVAQSFEVSKEQFASFKLLDGDNISVISNNNQFMNHVQIAGAVWRPGTYSISNNSKTLKDLLQMCGGLKEEAYMQRAYIQRLGENRKQEQVSFNLEDVVLGKSNINLLPDDYIKIYSIQELLPKETIQIVGEVNRQTEDEPYRRGMTLGDAILIAGGTTNAATLTKVEVGRRIKNTGTEINTSKILSDTVATIMYFNLLENPAYADFKLEPFDIVFVRRSPQYKPQQPITVTGEVLYPGKYVIEKNVVRLSDIIEKAKGFNKDAYVGGAKLTRTLTKEEMARLGIAMEIARKQSSDTNVIELPKIGEQFDIAINLAEAVSKPGSYADVVLRAGDIITVPKMNNTVRVSGAVLYPNTITFIPNKRISYYISNAGGLVRGALKGRMYIVHMNGSVAQKGSKDFIMRPGSELVVPMKDYTKQRGMSVGEIMSIATSTASLAAMVMSIVNISK